jgi:hypothetical protein
MASTVYRPVEGDDVRQTPTRLLVVQEETRPAVDLNDDDVVMTFPHLVVRELIVLVAASLFIVVISLIFDAPLEELANPELTPNPAKAPWYFLGLQELLHYYPPLISGVVLPGLVVVALVFVPYFDVNLSREPFWERGKKGKAIWLVAAIVAVSLVFYVTGAHPVWPLIGTTIGIGALMLLPAVLGTGTRFRRWLDRRSLAFWVFLWFLMATVVLTVIGVFFRGPGWSFTVPWVDGIY